VLLENSLTKRPKKPESGQKTLFWAISYPRHQPKKGIPRCLLKIKNFNYRAGLNGTADKGITAS
jgi:hypothetical protein